MNVLLLKRLLREQGPALIGCRLSSVNQYDERSIILRLGCEDGTCHLLLSVMEEYPALFIVEDPAELPEHDVLESNFAKALNFHLAGYQLDSISQSGFDRSVVFSFSAKDVYGQETVKQLRHELVGRASNAYLISDRNMVVSIFKRVRRHQNKVRHIITGKALPDPPALGKYIAAETSVEGLADELAELAGREGVEDPHSIESFFIRRVACCDVRLWPEVERLLPVEYDLDSLHGFITELQRGDHTSQLFGLKLRYDANQLCRDRWAEARDKRGQKSRQPDRVRERAANRLDQLISQRTLASHADEVEQLALDMLRQSAEIDVGGSAGVFLRQWMDQNADFAGQINLDHSTYDNAQELVHYAQRLRRGRNKLDDLIKKAEADLLKVEHTPRPAQKKRKRDRPDDPLAAQKLRLDRNGIKYLRFKSSDGMHILCGVSDKSNDGLLRAFGNGRHIWLHVRDYPGSHVIILNGGQPVSPRTLEEAALIAAHYSQGRKETDIDVSYLPMKQLRRPKGGKPGQVLKMSEKVITVRPQLFETVKHNLYYGGEEQPS